LGRNTYRAVDSKSNTTSSFADAADGYSDSEHSYSEYADTINNNIATQYYIAEHHECKRNYDHDDAQRH
jgi:hypothetical protein